MKPALLLLCLALPPSSSATAPRAPSAPKPKVSALAAEAARFVATYSGLIQGVSAVASEASWKASTDVKPEHDAARVAADKALAALTGSALVIEQTRLYRSRAAELDPLTARQLDKIWLGAAETPATLPDVTAKRIEAESRQRSILDSFQFCLKRRGAKCSQPTTANEIDRLLVSSRDMKQRLALWKASKETGAALKPGLEELRGLRNAVARHFGYASFYDLQVADYGMKVGEMSALLEGFLRDIQPLYQELHCWTKHELAKRYGQPVPTLIPAHWIGNRWAQNWNGIVEGVDLDPLFKDKTPEWIVKQAEEFYVSMGFPRLPEAFWTKSDLYPVAKGAKRSKNTHASAWHIDYEKDVRSLMSVESDGRWFGTSHHELGHIYYYLSYARPEVPLLLRAGANRAFHEGIGELINIAATQVPYLRQVGILPESQKIDQSRWLLNEALEETVAFLPWSAGVMSSWERDLYEADLPPEQWNARWWEYVRRFQGVQPPEPRGPELCDGCTKTHVSDDPAQYYDYAIATVLKYQLHTHICREILQQDPHACNYYGSKPVGNFLQGLLADGARRDWRELLRETTGQDLSTKPMMDYFAPMMDFLKKENAGRQCGWQVPTP